MNSEASDHKKPSHTPGPWTVGSGHYICSEEGVDGFVIAQVFGGKKSKEDESLIAAAPDLLAALDTLLKAYRVAVKLRDPNTDDTFTVQARNAIAKATGAA